jgi:phosphatidylinositol glycan class Q protein
MSCQTNQSTGKKYNPLKQRIDSCDFDIDQLLLGTLLFTLIFFLLPTTAIYFYFFAMVKGMLIITRLVMNLLLVLLNHFPLYQIALYFTDNQFLPGTYIHTLLQ